MLAAAGWKNPGDIDRSLICKRVSGGTIKTLDEIYPRISDGSLLQAPYPLEFEKMMG